MPPNPYHIGPVTMPSGPPTGLTDATTIAIAADDTPEPTFDPKTGMTRIESPDGSVVIRVGKPVPQSSNNDKFNRNLAEEIDQSELGRIASDLIAGIEADIQSVAQYHADLAEGEMMLGFKLEAPRSDATSTGAPTEGMSRFYHPLLAEAILRFQANARGELLPSEGPVKVAATGTDQGEGADDLAQALEDALNHYFTSVATEYYPDTTRMLFDVGFAGSGFKKCYLCPIRRRPVSESIASKHFVVSDATRDLRTCGRKTHILEMDATTLRRMQLLGVYRDIDLADPLGTSANPVDLQRNEVVGINPNVAQPKDRPRTLYESYAELDIPGYEDTDKKGKETGLRLPYRVTIDKDSREILEIRRNWDEDDDMKAERRVFVKYPYVNAMSFYGIGLFHMLGNLTRTLTGGTRLTLDSGMISNFPTFLYDKRAGRQLTNEFRALPGGGIPLEVPSGMTIANVAAPVPFKDVSPAFVSVLEALSEEGQRLAGTAEIQVGEGKQDAPVGTTLALLEQATKISDAVHKGLYAAQAEEFQIMRELFEDDPDALWRHSPRESETWDKDKIVQALHRCDIIPKADPNTPSQMHRVMKVQALVQMASQYPQLFGSRGTMKVAETAIRTLGFEDPSQYLQPDGVGPQQSDPKAQAALLTAQAAMQTAQARLADVQLKSKTFGAQQAGDAAQRQTDLQVAAAKMKTEQIIHSGRQQGETQRLLLRQQHERHMQDRDLASDQMAHAADLRADMAKTILGHASDHLAQDKDHAMQGTLASLNTPNGAQ